MPEIATLPNGERVEIPDGQDPPTYMNQVIMPAYEAGRIGPVVGNALRATGEPGSEIHQLPNAPPGSVERIELPNGRRLQVQVPEGWDVPAFLGRFVLPAYSSGQFGPVAGNKLETPGAGQIALDALKAAARPGDVITQAVQKVTGEPQGFWGRLAAAVGREGLNMAPYGLAGVGASAAVPGRVAGALARMGASGAVGAASSPESLESAARGAIVPALTSGVAEVAAPLWTKALTSAGILRDAATRQAAVESPSVARRLGELFEDVPALSSSGVHPNLPTLTAKRLGTEPARTPGDIYEIVKGGRGKEMIDEVAEAVRDTVGAKIGQYKLVIKNPQTGKPEALSFDEAWGKRSDAGRKSASMQGSRAHTWGLTKDQWDNEITASLNRINPNGEASAAYQAGLDAMRPAYALRAFLKKGFTGKGGTVVDVPRLQEQLNEYGAASAAGTAPNRIASNLGPHYERLQEILGHRPGQPIMPPPTVRPGTQAVVDAAASTDTGEAGTLTALPALLRRLSRWSGFGHGPGERLSPYDGWR
jgi:hypothetical protein